MTTSQNGWAVLEADSPYLYTWTVPSRTGAFKIRLRNGSAGFLLVHFLLWWSEVLEPLAGKILDDWGWAARLIRGSSTVISNHASGTAGDANATRWPMGTRLMKAWMVAKIHARLTIYAGCLRWGGDFHTRPDQMHTEINKPMAACEKAARRLMKTPRGKRILAANPNQGAVILS